MGIYPEVLFLQVALLVFGGEDTPSLEGEFRKSITVSGLKLQCVAVPRYQHIASAVMCEFCKYCGF
jgi:hypothetical protein